MGHVYAFVIALAGAALFAIVWGGAPERWAAALLLLATGATLLLSYRIGVSFAALDIGLFAIDAALLLALVAVELRFKRMWLSWACATQLLTVAVHLVKLYDPLLVPWMYSAAAGKLGYVVVLLLVLGTSGHLRAAAADAS